MENLVFTQLSISEIRQLFRQELQIFFESKPIAPTQPESDELLTVQDTAKFLSLSVPTIYGLISKGSLPVMKRSKRCYFSKSELINYLKQGRKKTITETGFEADNYIKEKAK
jgi:excisionase family DNA binding protein